MSSLSNARTDIVTGVDTKQRNMGRRSIQICVLMVCGLCVAKILGSSILVLVLLAGFLGLMGWSATHGLALPVLLFLVPWSPLMKLAPGGYSFFTFGLLLAAMVTAVKNKFVLKSYEWLGGFALAFVTLLSKLINGDMITVEYLLFMLQIVLFPLMVRESSKRNSFYDIAVAFSLGVVSAALLANLCAEMPNISAYIDIHVYAGLTRLSGFYGDANFYSAHVSAALAAMLVLMLHTAGRQKLNVIVLTILLAYCGLLSVSKTFALVAALVVFCWFVYLVKQIRSAGKKIAAVASVVVVLAVVVSIPAVADLLNTIWNRFAEATDLNSLTTSRASTWGNYLNTIFSDPKLLLLGEGYDSSAMLSRLSNSMLFRAPHNTLIQTIYQLGLLGTIMLVLWNVYFIKDMVGVQGRAKSLPVLILCIGGFLPWLALDMLFFDEFFFIQAFVCCGIREQKLLNGKKTD